MLLANHGEVHDAKRGQGGRVGMDEALGIGGFAVLASRSGSSNRGNWRCAPGERDPCWRAEAANHNPDAIGLRHVTLDRQALTLLLLADRCQGAGAWGRVGALLEQAGATGSVPSGCQPPGVGSISGVAARAASDGGFGYEERIGVACSGR